MNSFTVYQHPIIANADLKATLLVGHESNRLECAALSDDQDGP